MRSSSVATPPPSSRLWQSQFAVEVVLYFGPVDPDMLGLDVFNKCGYSHPSLALKR